MNGLETFLQSYGFWALFVAAAFEGDLTLLLTGVLIHLGIWPALQALAVGAAGALTGDIFYFWLGHGTARRWLTTAHGQRVLPHIECAAQRYGIWSLFFARYVYGARIATMFFWGMRRIPLYKFIGLNAINCVLWALTFGGLGYLFSTSIEAMVGEFRRLEAWILFGMVIFLLLLGARYYLAEFARIREETKAGPEKAE